MTDKKAIFNKIGKSVIPNASPTTQLAYLNLADMYLDEGREDLSDCVRYMLANDVRPLREHGMVWSWAKRISDQEVNYVSLICSSDWDMLIEHYNPSLGDVTAITFARFEDAALFILPLVVRDRT